MWTQETGTVPLPHTPPSGIELRRIGDISSDGSVLVFHAFNSINGQWLPFTWDRVNGYQKLALEGAFGERPLLDLVSADGTTVVGLSDIIGNLEALFRWTREAGATEIPLPLGASSGFARDLTPDGSIIVGEASSGAFVWDERNGAQDLRSLLIQEHGFSESDLPTLHFATQISADAMTLTVATTNSTPAALSAIYLDKPLIAFDWPEWNVDSGGNWSQAGNWTMPVPDAAGAVAIFGDAITQPRTVSLDAPITLARIEFNNANAYTLAGAGTLTFDASYGGTRISVLSGNHTISAAVTLADNATIFVTPAASNLGITGALLANGKTLTKTGAGTLTLNNLRAAGLTIGAGTVAVAPNGTDAGTSVVGALTIAGGAAPTAKLDLSNNAAIINYAGTSPAATVRDQILSGRGGAGLGKTWNGQGITSSAAATVNATEPESRSLAYAENSSLPLGPYTTFGGQPVDNTSVLIAFSRTGDANLDGVVNDDDVTIVGAAYAPGVPQPSWALGDFDYNGFVDDDDVTLLGAFYDPTAAPLISATPSSNVTAVPEPGTWALLIAAIVVISLREMKHAASRGARGLRLSPFAPRKYALTRSASRIV
jgi:hypothetical protein